MMNPNRLSELSRRQFMAKTAASALGVSVGASFAQAAELPGDMKMIFCYMAGGMSHVDSFDPQPGTDEAGPLETIKTNAADIQLSSNYADCAKHMDKVTVVRSMYSTQGAHGQGDYYMHTGYTRIGTITHPSLASWSHHHLGKINSKLPGTVVISPGTAYPYSGFMPPELSPMPIGEPTKGLQNSAPPDWVTASEFDHQLGMAEAFNASFRAKHKQSSLTAYQKFYSEAVELMKSKDLDAFDLSKETAATREKYGQDSKFGHGLPLARRLIENNVRTVEVIRGGWDAHPALDNEPHLDLDRGLAALLGDLEERGLLKKTIVVVCTECGRSPKIQNSDIGRDHWAKAFSAVLAGGPFKRGYVHGATDRGYESKTGHTTIPDFHTTIATAMGMPAKKIVMSPSGRPFNVGHKGTVIKDVFA
jgi:uncharacterized protein (DUF1501 family)